MKTLKGTELAKRQVAETVKSITQFTIGAAFFACRSCKYSKHGQLGVALAFPPLVVGGGNFTTVLEAVYVD
jgi:hypothetical protein